MGILKKSCIYIALIIAIYICFISIASTAKASGINSEKVFYLNDKQSITGTLFTKDELIGPGGRLVKEFYIVNNNDFECFLNSIVLDGKLYDQERNLLKKNDEMYKNYMKNAAISFYCNERLIYSGDLDEIVTINLTGEDLIKITENEKNKFSVEYALDEEADNRTMNMEHKFDITFNFSANNSGIIDNNKPPVNDNSGGGKGLVQTGYFIDFQVLIILGSLICIIGLVLLQQKFIVTARKR